MFMGIACPPRKFATEPYNVFTVLSMSSTQGSLSSGVVQ
jgi:hypothetical protein